MTIGLRSALALAAGAALILAACDRGPDSRAPTTPGPTAPGPGPQGSPTTVRIEITAPGEMEPGESVQLSARAVKSDGSVEDVTGQATWFSTAPSVVLLQQTTVVAIARGEAYVRATLGTRTTTGRIFVLPKGTFALKGVVHDHGILIPDATVEVLSGVGQGLRTKSDSAGNYALFGVGGSVQIHLKRDGYLNASLPMSVTEHLVRDLAILAERPNLYSGAYRLTITAAPTGSCFSLFGVLPDETRQRVYDAAVVQEGNRLGVTLSGADFILSNGRGNSFVGYVSTPDRVNFKISDAWWDYYYGGFRPGTWDLVERVSGSEVFVFGSVAAAGGSARLSGPLSGTIARGPANGPPFQPFAAYCDSSSHQFEMVRR